MNPHLTPGAQAEQAVAAARSRGDRERVLIVRLFALTVVLLVVTVVCALLAIWVSPAVGLYTDPWEGTAFLFGVLTGIAVMVTVLALAAADGA